MSMSRIKQDLGLTTTSLALRVTDGVLGRPAAGLTVAITGPDGTTVRGRTDADGRARVPGDVAAGEHLVVLKSGAWQAAQERTTLFAAIEVRLTLAAGEQHELIVLLGPYGYTVARG